MKALAAAVLLIFVSAVAAAQNCDEHARFRVTEYVSIEATRCGQSFNVTLAETSKTKGIEFKRLQFGEGREFFLVTPDAGITLGTGSLESVADVTIRNVVRGGQNYDPHSKCNGDCTPWKVINDATTNYGNRDWAIARSIMFGRTNPRYSESSDDHYEILNVKIIIDTLHNRGYEIIESNGGSWGATMWLGNQ